MKVYIIKGKCLSEDAPSFVYNVYASREKAIKVLNDLISYYDGYSYYISQYDVIE